VGIFETGELSPPIGIRREGTPQDFQVGFTICFEDLFPYIHRYYAKNGAQLFVNTTNDAWFDGSTGARWHLDAARWRSLETHLPMVRATNSGMTVAIDPLGNVTESVPPEEKGILTTEVTLLENPPMTVYTRIGDLFGWGALAGSLLLTLLCFYREKKNSQRSST